MAAWRSRSAMRTSAAPAGEHDQPARTGSGHILRKVSRGSKMRETVLKRWRKGAGDAHAHGLLARTVGCSTALLWVTRQAGAGGATQSRNPMIPTPVLCQGCEAFRVLIFFSWPFFERRLSSTAGEAATWHVDGAVQVLRVWGRQSLCQAVSSIAARIFQCPQWLLQAATHLPWQATDAC